MAIQLRRGAYDGFDPAALLPGELAVVTSGDPGTQDGRAVYACVAAGDAKRVVTADSMPPQDVQDGAVTTAKLADGSVTRAKLGDDVVTEPADGTVTTRKLADGAVVGEKIGIGAVGTSNVANEAITDAKLADVGIKSRFYGIFGNFDGHADGTTVSVEDAAEQPLIKLVVSGNSTRSGTPSTTAPVYPASVSALSLHAGASLSTDGDGWPVAIALEGHEMRKLPDGTSDTLTLSYVGSGSRDGYGLYSVVLEVNVGEHVVDGSTPIQVFTKTSDAGGNACRLRFTRANAIPDATSATIDERNSYCSHARRDGTSVSSHPLPGVYTTNDYHVFLTLDPSFTTAAQASAWLAQNPVTFWYPLNVKQSYNLGTVELPSLPAPTLTLWAVGGNADPSNLSLTYELATDATTKKFITGDMLDGSARVLPTEYTDCSMFTRIGVIGDSYCTGALYLTPSKHLIVYSQSWPANLGRQCGVGIKRYSVAGWGSYEFLFNSSDNWHSYGSYKLAQDLSADATKCGLYIISFGINDSNTSKQYGDKTGGAGYIGSSADVNLSDYTQNGNSFWGNLGRIVGMINEAAPNSRIIITTLGRFGTSRYDAYNDVVPDIAEYLGVPCIRLTDDPFFTSPFYTEQQLEGHPTAQIYAGMAKAINRLISECIVNNWQYFSVYEGLE